MVYLRGVAGGGGAAILLEGRLQRRQLLKSSRGTNTIVDGDGHLLLGTLSVLDLDSTQNKTQKY
jgi:hypothetical protein